jgi:uncharacterized protein DUF6082
MMKRVDIREFVNSLTIRIGILALAVGVLALVVVSPIALQRIARIHGIDWMRLSNVGQTYGAISALLTALALGGVVISLLYQASAFKTAREQASRTIHTELMKMEMESPFYMATIAGAWGPKYGFTDYDSLRRNHLIHMWVSYWEGQYMLHDMPDAAVRGVANDLFISVAGRRYWSMSKTFKLKYYKGRRLRFTRMVDEEYKKAIASGPPVANSFEDSSGDVAVTTSRQISRTESKVLILAAAGAAILAGRLLERQLSRRS